MINFLNPDYLKNGSRRQRDAFECLTKLNIFNDLKEFAPTLVGTIPIGIDIPDSDLDIVCYCSNHLHFSQKLSNLYSSLDNTEITHKAVRGIKSTICRFEFMSFRIEIFGQSIPVSQQYGYRHMVIEHEILVEKGPLFREEVIRLKRAGFKTEPAFAKLLDLEGDPYQALLDWHK